MRRPGLVVSVRDAAEAAAARDGGADVIDVKEPSRGPLGPPDAGVIEAVVAAAGSTPVSVACGDLADAAGASPPAGVAYAKLGTARAGGAWARRFRAALNATAAPFPVAAAYADAGRVGAPWPEPVLEAGRGVAAGLLVDTAVKDGRGLFDWLEADRLARLVGAAHGAGLFVALAGELSAETAARAAELGPDWIAVRGAVCGPGGRETALEPERIPRLRDAIADAAMRGFAGDRGSRGRPSPLA